MGLAEALLDETSKAVEVLAADPPPPGWETISCESASDRGRLLTRGDMLDREAVAGDDVAWAGLVIGSDYRDLALDLIGATKKEIRVRMFL